MKKIKWNWGTGIFLSIVIFMMILIGLVYVFMNQDVDLVTKNYYGKELKYQGQIDKINNTTELAKQVGISFINNSIQLTFPDSVFFKKLQALFIFIVLQHLKKILLFLLRFLIKTNSLSAQQNLIKDCGK